MASSVGLEMPNVVHAMLAQVGVFEETAKRNRKMQQCVRMASKAIGVLEDVEEILQALEKKRKGGVAFPEGIQRDLTRITLLLEDCAEDVTRALSAFDTSPTGVFERLFQTRQRNRNQLSLNRALQRTDAFIDDFLRRLNTKCASLARIGIAGNLKGILEHNTMAREEFARVQNKRDELTLGVEAIRAIAHAPPCPPLPSNEVSQELFNAHHGPKEEDADLIAPSALKLISASCSNWPDAFGMSMAAAWATVGGHEPPNLPATSVFACHCHAPISSMHLLYAQVTIPFDL